MQGGSGRVETFSSWSCVVVTSLDRRSFARTRCSSVHGIEHVDLFAANCSDVVPSDNRAIIDATALSLGHFAVVAATTFLYLIGDPFRAIPRSIAFVKIKNYHTVLIFVSSGGLAYTAWVRSMKLRSLK